MTEVDNQFYIDNLNVFKNNINAKIMEVTTSSDINDAINNPHAFTTIVIKPNIDQTISIIAFHNNEDPAVTIIPAGGTTEIQNSIKDHVAKILQEKYKPTSAGPVINADPNAAIIDKLTTAGIIDVSTALSVASIQVKKSDGTHAVETDTITDLINNTGNVYDPSDIDALKNYANTLSGGSSRSRKHRRRHKRRHNTKRRYRK